MKRAKRLLEETDLKVVDIAFESGFHTSQYFNTVFHEMEGITPTKYRNKWKNMLDES